MNTLFVFGAGASLHCGAPLVRDFLKDLHVLKDEVDSLPHYDRLRMAEAILDVQSACKELSWETAATDLEEVFSFVDTALQIQYFGSREPRSIKMLRKNLCHVVMFMLERRVKFKNESGRLVAPYPYGQLVHLLRSIRSRNYCFITLNYDVALDSALYEESRKPQYCLVPTNDLWGGSCLLKLHGSMNWRSCSEPKNRCQKVTSFPVDPRVFTKEQLGDHPFFPVPVRGKRHPLCDCGAELEPTPLIVPPTWNKRCEWFLEEPWKTAGMALRQAHSIVIVGYSMPPTDQYFRSLFKFSLLENQVLKQVVVVDIRESEELRRHWECFLKPQLTDKLRIISKPFIKALFGESEVPTVQVVQHDPIKFMYGDLLQVLSRCEL